MQVSIFCVQDHYPQRSRSIAEFYNEMISQCCLAEELGYAGFFLAEHHFHEYGVVPNPAVALSALAQHTQRIRLGTAISVLPFRNPLTVAEDYAMLDVLSGGRLTLGVGSGYLKHEFEGFGVPGEQKRDRFDENLDLLKRLLAGERITHHSDFISLDDIAINVLPLQKPTPPILVAILRKEAAYHIGRRGEKIICVPYASVDSFDRSGRADR